MEKEASITVTRENKSRQNANSKGVIDDMYLTILSLLDKYIYIYHIPNKVEFQFKNLCPGLYFDHGYSR